MFGIQHSQKTDSPHLCVVRLDSGVFMMIVCLLLIENLLSLLEPTTPFNWTVNVLSSVCGYSGHWSLIVSHYQLSGTNIAFYPGFSLPLANLSHIVSHKMVRVTVGQFCGTTRWCLFFLNQSVSAH